MNQDLKLNSGKYIWFISMSGAWMRCVHTVSGHLNRLGAVFLFWWCDIVIRPNPTQHWTLFNGDVNEKDSKYLA